MAPAPPPGLEWKLGVELEPELDPEPEPGPEGAPKSRHPKGATKEQFVRPMHVAPVIDR